MIDGLMGIVTNNYLNMILLKVFHIGSMGGVYVPTMNDLCGKSCKYASCMGPMGVLPRFINHLLGSSFFNHLLQANPRNNEKCQRRAATTKTKPMKTKYNLMTSAKTHGPG